MKEILLENEFKYVGGVFTREFRGSYATEKDDGLNVEATRDVVVAKANIFKLNDEWVLTLYKINPTNGLFVKVYENMNIEKEDRDGEFFNLLLANIYVNKFEEYYCK